MRNGRIVGLALVALMAISLGVAFATTPRSDRYEFNPASHPISMVRDDGGRWLYYSAGKQDLQPLLQAARSELLAKGFREDTSDRPWFRFVNGEKQVIVCYHDEIASGPGGVVHAPELPGRRPNRWAVVWTRQEGGNPFELAMFEAKKLALGW